MRPSRERLAALIATVLVHVGVIAGLASLNAPVRDGEIAEAPALIA